MQAPADPAHVAARIVAPRRAATDPAPAPVRAAARPARCWRTDDPARAPTRPAAPGSGRRTIARHRRCRGRAGATRQPAGSRRSAPALPRHHPHRQGPPPRYRVRSGHIARWTPPTAPPRAVPPDGWRQSADPADAGRGPGNGCAAASSLAARSARPGHLWQHLRRTPVIACHVLFSRDQHGGCTSSGPGQHGRDGDRNGAGTHGEAATGSNDRTSDSASLPARVVRPGRRRRAASPSRRPPPDHPSTVQVNRDASLFLAASPRLAFQRRRRQNFEPASPDTGPSGRHASAAPAGFADSVGPLRAASGGGPVRRNRHRSRFARGHNRCTRRPRSRTTHIRTDGQTPARSARHRRRGVDERRSRQDTRPACVLSGTVWGAAPGQNGQVQSGAVLTLKSGRRPPGCRGACCAGYPSKAAATSSTSHPLRSCRHAAGANAAARTALRRQDTGTASAPAQRRGSAGHKATISGMVGWKSVGKPGSMRVSADNLAVGRWVRTKVVRLCSDIW